MLSKRLAFVIVLGSVAVLAAGANLPLAKATWVRLSGAVIPHGSRTHSYSGQPVRVLSGLGQRWVTWAALEDASAYHTLVIFPPAALVDDRGISGGDGFNHKQVVRWQLSRSQPAGYFAEQIALEIVYDAVWRTVTIDSRTFDLADGNLFVVRYDERLGSAVTQLNATLNKDADIDEVIGAFKAGLREEPMLRQL